MENMPQAGQQGQQDQGEGEPDNFTIRKLDDGTFTLSVSFKGGGNSEEYSYQTADELLSDLKSDLGGGDESQSQDEAMSQNSKMAKQITSAEEPQ